MTRPRLAAAAALAVLALAVRYGGLRGEDFVYYYCAGRVSARGASPYDPGPYQACLDQAFGGSNPHVSRGTGSAYPPPAVPLFRAFAAMPYGTAFIVWNAVLAMTSGLLLCMAGSGWSALLLATWPGFILCWAYHKITLLLFAVLLGGSALISSGEQLGGGVVLSLLALQPQWLAAAGLFLVARRRWRALAALLFSAFSLFVLCDLGTPLWPWFQSASRHAQEIVGLDNQSLFVALFKIFRPLTGPVESHVFQAVRSTLSLALGLAAWLYARRKDDLPGFLLLILLAQPYSHGSDILWAFPLFAALVPDVRLGLAVNALAAAAFGFYTPGRLHAGGWEWGQGFAACALAAAWGAARLSASRTAEAGASPSSRPS